MWESKLFLTSLHTTLLHTTRHDSTELFKIFFSLLTLQLLFCKKLVGREKIIFRATPHYSKTLQYIITDIRYINTRKYSIYLYFFLYLNGCNQTAICQNLFLPRCLSLLFLYLFVFLTPFSLSLSLSLSGGGLYHLNAVLSLL